MPKKNNSPFVVALTGGIGSGKSTVLGMFKTKGAKTVDCDAIVHQLLNQNKGLLTRIQKKFGRDMFDSRGRLIRQKLAGQVFPSASKRRFLERLIHPLVREDIKRQVNLVSNKLVIVDIPLYFESRWEKRIRPVIVVEANQTTRFHRLKKKGYSMHDILSRMKAQWPLEQKVRRADFVVNNNGSKSETKKQVHHIWKKLIPQNERGNHGIRTRKKSR